MVHRLTAIMLGRLRMTVQQAKDQYKVFGNAVFGKPRAVHARSLAWWPRPKYSTTKKKEAIHEVIGPALRRLDHSLETEYAVRETIFGMAEADAQRCQRSVKYLLP
jgi:hypothetical protein